MQKFRHFWRKKKFTRKSHLRLSCTKPFSYTKPFHFVIVKISDLPENVRERWNAFVSGKLADVNKQNLSELVSFKTESMGVLTTYYHGQKSWDRYALLAHLYTCWAWTHNTIIHLPSLSPTPHSWYLHFLLSFKIVLECGTG